MLGFSTGVRIQRGKGFCAKRCWLAVLSHLGSFHKEVGGWKISKHIHFTAGESRQYGERFTALEEGLQAMTLAALAKLATEMRS